MNETEKKTVAKMISIYCAAKHGISEGLCDDCAELNEYARKRLEKCTFGDNKPTCEKCPVHCYRPDMRMKIRNVMQFSGPRMLFHNPVLAIRHLLKNLR
ncbi:hypothetical protein GGR21_001712 [Dysgonomonas hofstadii]|uniref:Nitrous oxide-stimulated promoter n=1 Tax=Dysgonomonas hofstadii TaxID=637886 RepID=A0A840CIF6_9BACT|nr:nitrous oxide-stimulated promoter family protein [Dysgonomonas hofstadii]MBB4035817.1 hypothetical protein [Dysgonomonas hofstadii]